MSTVERKRSVASYRSISSTHSARSRIGPVGAMPCSSSDVATVHPETTLLDEDDNGIKAYHHSSQYHESSVQTDLFWALIGTRRFIEDEPLTDGAALVQAASVSISHELAETFSDRDSAGFRPQTASQKGEISDLCKGDFYFYGSFQVQKYWSIWSTGCIHGNDPVSLRQFLKSISFDTAHHGLRSLGMATLNLESIASQMRSLAPAGMV